MISFRELLVEKITRKQLSDLEKFADKILQKYDLDVEFTKHFFDRLNDSRNDPEIKISELQKLFKKIEKHHGERLKEPGAQLVIKDLQTDLNLPVVIKLKNGVFEIVTKTIMRKKNFKTSNKKVEY